MKQSTPGQGVREWAEVGAIGVLLKLKSLANPIFGWHLTATDRGRSKWSSWLIFLYLSPRQAEEFLEYFGDSRS